MFSIHKNTVRAWIKNGLQACDGKRPTLILGREPPSFWAVEQAGSAPADLVNSIVSDAALPKLRPQTWLNTDLLQTKLET